MEETKYTAGGDAIRFLTDRCIAQSFETGIPAKNAVPSFDLAKNLSATTAQQIAAAESNSKLYADKIAADLAAETARAEVEEARLADRTAALEETVPANKLAAEEAVENLSAAVVEARYAVAAATKFEYDANAHALKLLVQDREGSCGTLSVDASQFIANGIVDHIEVDRDESAVKVYWKNQSGSLESISVPISELIQAYRGGSGIGVGLNGVDGIYEISADDTIARTADVAAQIGSAKAEAMSHADEKASEAQSAAEAKAAAASAALSGRTAALESYASELSVAGGKIASLEADSAEAKSGIAANAAAAAAAQAAADRAQAMAETAVQAAHAEEDRATAAETAVSAGLATEIARAGARENEIAAMLDSKTAANAATVQSLSQTVADKTASLDARASKLETAAESLASKTAAIETDLAQETNRADSTEKQLSSDTAALAIRVDACETAAAAAKSSIASLEAFKTELSSGSANPGGAIPAICADVGAISARLATSMAYSGKIAFSKAEPDAVIGSADAKLSSFLKGLNLDKGTGYIANGAVFEVAIANAHSEAEAFYDTDDGFKLADGDMWTVVAPDGADAIALSAIDGSSFRRMDFVQGATVAAKFAAVEKLVEDEASAARAVEAELCGRVLNAQNAIDGKIYIDGVSANWLFVRHVSQDEYYQLKQTNAIDKNTVYEISADDWNMYSEKITNLLSGTDAGDAVNVAQMQAALHAESKTLSDATRELESRVDAVKAAVVESLQSIALSSEVKDIAAALIALRDAVSNV